MKKSVYLLPIMLLLAACASGGTSSRSGSAPVDTSKIFIIQEDMPKEAQSIASGRDLLNKLIHLGKAEENIEPTPVQIGSLAENVEKGVVSSLKGSSKSYSFKGASKPQNVRAWLAEQGIKEGRILDTEVESWGVRPYPKDKYRYYVFLKTNTTLTDIGKNKVIGSYACASSTEPNDPKTAPTKYELLKEDKALIKKMYRERAADCAARTVKSIL